VRRALVSVLLAGLLGACSAPEAAPVAASVDGHDISMSAYQARLAVSRARDPFAGIPSAIPSPASPQRLEDFTIEQLVREQIIRQEAANRKITVSDSAVKARIAGLKAATTEFEATLQRNGFTDTSFQEYETVLLTEVALIEGIARQRAASAAKDLAAGQSFDAAVAKWNDDQGTAGHGGEVGWLRPDELPEAELRPVVQSLAPGATSSLVKTSRGFVIARVAERQAERVHLYVLLVLAPSVELFTPQATPAWFSTLIADKETQLRRDGKIRLRVGSHASA
jgi:parvulin-like peptidyl-prolyl isomerase